MRTTIFSILILVGFLIDVDAQTPKELFVQIEALVETDTSSNEVYQTLIAQYRELCATTENSQCTRHKEIDFLEINKWPRSASKELLLNKCKAFNSNYKNTSDEQTSLVSKKINSLENLIKNRDPKTWNRVVEQRTREAVENFFNESEEISFYYNEAKMKLEDLRVTDTDSFFVKGISYYKYFIEGTENKYPQFTLLDSAGLIFEATPDYLIAVQPPENSIEFEMTVPGSPWKKLKLILPQLPEASGRQGGSSKNIFLNSKDSITKQNLIILVFLLTLIACFGMFCFSILRGKDPILTIKDVKTIGITERTVESQNEIVELDYISETDLNISEPDPNEDSKPVDKLVKIVNTKSKDQPVFNQAQFDSIFKHKTLRLELEDLWDDSVVSSCYLTEHFVRKLDDYLFIQCRETIQELEIGGFILGKAIKREDGKYDVSFETFIDIESEDQNLYKIEFGTKAWKKLSRTLEQSEYQDQQLIGWFHTHPGHSVFLSKPDLFISDNFFKFPYQVAVELDPIITEQNPKLDLGIFTKKTSGSMNNVEDLKTSYFNWFDVIKANDTE